MSKKRHHSVTVRFQQDIVAVPVPFEQAEPLKTKLSDISNTMRSTLDNAMEQGQSISELYKMTESLERSSDQFRTRSSTVAENIKNQESMYSMAVYVSLSVLCIFFGYALFKFGMSAVNLTKDASP